MWSHHATSCMLTVIHLPSTLQPVPRSRTKYFVWLVLETRSYFHVSVLTHNQVKFSSLPSGEITAKIQGILKQGINRRFDGNREGYGLGGNKNVVLCFVRKKHRKMAFKKITAQNWDSWQSLNHMPFWWAPQDSSRVCENFILAMADNQEDAEDHALDDFSYRIVPVWTPSPNTYKDDLDRQLPSPSPDRLLFLNTRRYSEALQKGWLAQPFGPIKLLILCTVINNGIFFPIWDCMPSACVYEG